MKHNLSRLVLMTSVVVTVLVLSAMMTLPVLADGGETPPPPTDTPTEVTPLPTETATPVPTEEIATPTTVDPVATDTPVADPTEVVPTDTPVTDPPVSTDDTTTTDPNILSQVPNDTQVVVTDADGNALPLASTDAAEAIATSDPIWCPSGVLIPVGGGSGCSPAMTSMTDLISWLTANNPGAAGTIWIAKDYNSSTAVGDGAATGFTLDGLVLTNMANYALTVKGGWNGLGTGSVDTTSPSTFDGDSFSIIHWKGDVTLNDLLITNVPGAGSTALTVKTTKKVTTNRVKVQTNVGAGAKIDNTASGTGTGDVQITLSQFLNNAGGMGLEVDSRGAITLSGVLADGNGGGGANLDNSTAPSAKNVTINGTNSFGGNTGPGLNILSKGNVLLTKVTVKGNSGAGAKIDNAVAGTGVGNVSVTLSQFLNNTGGTGLEVDSRGAITLSGVLADGNGNDGVNLDNSTAAVARNVTINIGINEFNNNTGYGLHIYSKGAVILKDITANANGTSINNASGARVDNSIGTAQPVTITGTNVFSENAWDGLIVLSSGAISASNLVANDNGYWGAYLDNSSATTALPVAVSGINEFKYNGVGLWIQSQGAITTSNLTVLTVPNLIHPVSDNAVHLQNNYNFTSNVTMTGTNVITGNYYSGLEIYSKGIITLYNVTANNNGFMMPDPAVDGNGYGAILDNSSAVTPMAVILYGTNSFSNNYSGGLKITSKGAVTLNNVTAKDNITGFGADIDNHLGVGGVTLKNTAAYFPIFSNNGTYGLKITTTGAIVIGNITANKNKNGIGTQLDNQTYGVSTSLLGVTITGINSFSGNSLGGLVVKTYGAILMSNVTASDNTSGYGADLSNKDSATPQAVTLMGYGHFDRNVAGGLAILTKGAITLSTVTANGNTGGIGARLDNQTYGSAALPQNVTLTGTNSFSGNSKDGLVVLSYGTVTLSNVTASNNTGGYGASLRNCILDDSYPSPVNWRCIGVSTPKNITITGTNTFNGNFADGLRVDTYGAILLNSLTANDNGQNGAWLDNSQGITPKAVTLNGINIFYNNGVRVTSYGLSVTSLGQITVDKLDVSNNKDFGAALYNDFSNALGGITITGWVYADNNYAGLQAISRGNIMVANLNINKALGSGNGIMLTSHGGNVTVSGSSQIFNVNYNGLVIQTYGGSVTLNNMTVSGNGVSGTGNGIWIQVLHGGTSVPTVTLTGTNIFWNNGENGLKIETYGAINISNIDTYNNGANGVYLDNRGAASKPIIITGSNFFEKNGSDGLYAASFGAISISNIHSTNNTGRGAYLDNSGVADSPNGITLSGINSFENNGAQGLWALSSGVISMSNLTVNQNTSSGVLIDNTNYSGTLARAVTISGVNIFTNNGNHGVSIVSSGQITVNNVTATGNQGSGVKLDNSFANNSLKPGIKVTGLNTFNQNGDYGLKISSDGAVDMVSITADLNGLHGLYVYTSSGLITLACGSMNNNAGSGWNLTSALITLKGVFGFGNTSGNYTSSTPIVSRTCPLAIPVVIQPKDDSDSKPHGSRRSAPVYQKDDYWIRK